MNRLLKFLGTVWGWLAVAGVAGGASLLTLYLQEQYDRDLNLHIWPNVQRETAPHGADS